MAKFLISRNFSSVPATIELLDKFKGSLVGGLVGDCCGRPFRLSDDISKVQLQKYFDKLDGPYFKAPYKPYSANIALSNSVAKSLTTLRKFDAVDVSKNFVRAYFDNPHRDYGGNIATVFAKLRGSKFTDPYGPAAEQYLGSGSYGNKAAAFSAPFALFFYHNPKDMVDSITKASAITNSNKHGKNGALLQTWAVRLALDLQLDSPDLQQYYNELCKKVDEFETDEEGLNLSDAYILKKQMNLVKKLLEKESPTESEVINTLGHSRVAFFSVPTAIYCFLRADSKIPGIETDNKFRRTIQYATALGGDCDTIAAMAGSIAGGCYGYSSISKSLQAHCEGLNDVLNLSEAISSV